MTKPLMTRGAVALVLAAVLSTAAYANGAAEPFTVALPDAYAAFTRQVQITKSPEGDIETTNWISKAPTGEAVIVTVSRMPARILDPQKMIDSTRASLLKSLGATLETEEPRPGELPSSRLLFRTDSAFFRARFTVLDDRFYQILYVGRSAEQRTAPEVGQIFESFRIADAAAVPQS